MLLEAQVAELTGNEYNIDRPDSEGAAADGLSSNRPLSARSSSSDDDPTLP